MTAEIVNLRRFRKLKERDAKAAEAVLNRSRSGRTKVERDMTDAERSNHNRVLDGAHREPVSTPIVTPVAANAAGFPNVAQHDDEELDPGNVS